ncbi:MAG: HAD family hydrolase [Candidatus Microgenomates bacterium]|jgi:phosphoserine phosphatase
MKKLALFDIDGVIYNGHTIFDQIQDWEKRGVVAKGTWDKILIELSEYKSGKKNYKQAADRMLEIYAQAVKGKSPNIILEDTYKFLNHNKDKFFPYFENLVSQIKDTYDIYFVTTNFQFMCEALGRIYGVKNYLSSIAGIANGKFTGRVELSLGGNKGIAADLISKYGKKGSIAVGDSENDADMLNKVDFPVVIEPNSYLKDIAREKGWQIVNRDTIADIIRAYAR